MSAASAPRLSGGIAASILLHGALIAVFLVRRPATEPMQPPMYRVQLIAAPAGDPTAGVVQDQPTPAAPQAAPQPVAAAQPVVPKPAPAPPKHAPVKPVKAAPRAATPSPAATTTTPKPQPAPAPTAGGGQTGGHGSDVANVDTPGIEFPYPAYTTNIVSQLIRRFGPMAGSSTATVRFVIRRDGTVDPESIKIVTPSGNYSFDTRAVGAVESAANAKAFGRLPDGFREDILPVTFRFSPALNR